MPMTSVFMTSSSPLSVFGLIAFAADMSFHSYQFHCKSHQYCNSPMSNQSKSIHPDCFCSQSSSNLVARAALVHIFHKMKLLWILFYLFYKLDSLRRICYQYINFLLDRTFDCRLSFSILTDLSAVWFFENESFFSN